jgi:hypothetical protein
MAFDGGRYEFRTDEARTLDHRESHGPGHYQEGNTWDKVRKGTAWNRIVAAVRDPELAAVVMLCAIGLLVALALLLAFPNYGETTQSIQQFL